MAGEQGRPAFPEKRRPSTGPPLGPPGYGRPAVGGYWCRRAGREWRASCGRWEPTRAGLEILHLGDCFGLLKSVPLGRVGFIAGGEVVILPVNFLVDGQDVVFRTGAGSKLSAVEVGHFVGSRPTLRHRDADRLVSGGQRAGRDRRGRRRGRAARRPRADELGAATDRVWVRVRPSSVSGRRIAPTAATERARSCSSGPTAGGWPGRPRRSAACASGRSARSRRCRHFPAAV